MTSPFPTRTLPGKPISVRLIGGVGVVIYSPFKQTKETSMKKEQPGVSDQVPETDSTYERTRSSTVKKDVQPNASSKDVRKSPLPSGGTIEGDMKTEEPTGWDQAPQEATSPRNKRQPRPDGVGGSDPNSSVDRTNKQ